jgi:hypothetical protein
MAGTTTPATRDTEIASGKETATAATHETATRHDTTTDAMRIETATGATIPAGIGTGDIMTTNQDEEAGMSDNM